MLMENQKSTIIQRSENLFFRYGIRSVTMDDIARELGISKKTLYQFFENKNQLLTDMMTEHNNENRDTIVEIQKNAADALDEIQRVTQHVLGELARLSPALMFDLQKYYTELWANVQTISMQHILAHVRHNLERGIEEGLYRPDLNVDVISKLYVSKVYCVIDESIFPQSEYDKKELFLEYIRYHLYGILSEKGRAAWKSRIQS
jgi:TetR/AcrR family transcriptional regulator, cholesterol catabolism regulator